MIGLGPRRPGQGLRRAAAVAAWLLAALLLPAGPARADTPACAPPAQAPDDTALAALQRDARDHGMLWRITRDGRTSWLYGTLHVGRRAWAAPGPVVRRALAASQLLAVELDPTDPGTQAQLQARLAPDPRLSLTPELDARLAVQLERACLPPAMARQVAPDLLGPLLMLAAARPDGYEAAFGIDLALIRAARARGTPVHALETAALQLDSLLSRTDAELRSGLDATLTALERGEVRPMMARLAQLWADGRDDELARYADWCACAETPDDRARLARLLDGRNPGLADGIERLHADGRAVFAAVGSLHLVGPAGLPALLAARGFTVAREPLPPPPARPPVSR